MSCILAQHSRLLAVVIGARTACHIDIDLERLVALARVMSHIELCFHILVHLEVVGAPAASLGLQLVSLVASVLRLWQTSRVFAKASVAHLRA